MINGAADWTKSRVYLRGFAALRNPIFGRDQRRDQRNYIDLSPRELVRRRDRRRNCSGLIVSRGFHRFPPRVLPQSFLLDVDGRQIVILDSGFA